MKCDSCRWKDICPLIQGDLAGKCRCYEPKKVKSNADRIRSMSDEELVIFLDNLTCLCVDCNEHDGKNENCPIYKQGCGRYCQPKDFISWLRQPVKEDT